MHKSIGTCRGLKRWESCWTVVCGHGWLVHRFVGATVEIGNEIEVTAWGAGSVAI